MQIAAAEKDKNDATSLSLSYKEANIITLKIRTLTEQIETCIKNLKEIENEITNNEKDINDLNRQLATVEIGLGQAYLAYAATEKEIKAVEKDKTRELEVLENKALSLQNRGTELRRMIEEVRLTNIISSFD